MVCAVPNSNLGRQSGFGYLHCVNHLRYIIAFALLFASVFSFGQKAKHASVKQTSFCEDAPDDDSRLKPTILPRSVVAELMNTEQGKDANELAENEGTHLDPAKVLRGTKIHLSDSGGPFYLVMGSHPMSGADNTWFWLVRDDSKRANVLLFAGGNCLDIGTKSTLGYRNITTFWSSPSETITTTYVYDGRRYRLLRKRSRPNS